MIKLIAVLFLVLSKISFAVQGLELSPILGVNVQMQGVFTTFDDSFSGKVGQLKKSSVPWKKIISTCGGEKNFGNVVYSNNAYVAQRCCYKTLDELGVVGVPLATSGGAHALVSLPKVQTTGLSLATAQFQKVSFPDKTSKNILATCMHVVYGDGFVVDPNSSPLALAKTIKGEADRNPTWGVEYFYVESETPCALILKSGDLNGDGKISSLDILKLKKDYTLKGVYDMKYDFNSDGKLDSGDEESLRSYLLQTLDCQQ